MLLSRCFLLLDHLADVLLCLCQHRPPVFDLILQELGLQNGESRSERTSQACLGSEAAEPLLHIV